MKDLKDLRNIMAKLRHDKNNHVEALGVLKSILPYKVRKAHQQGKQGAQNHNDYAILSSAPLLSQINF